VDSLNIPFIGPAGKDLLNEYLDSLLQYIRVIVNHRNLMSRVNKKAEGLIEFFKKKYDFD